MSDSQERLAVSISHIYQTETRSKSENMRLRSSHGQNKINQSWDQKRLESLARQTSTKKAQPSIVSTAHVCNLICLSHYRDLYVSCKQAFTGLTWWKFLLPTRRMVLYGVWVPLVVIPDYDRLIILHFNFVISICSIFDCNKDISTAK